MCVYIIVLLFRPLLFVKAFSLCLSIDCLQPVAHPTWRSPPIGSVFSQFVLVLFRRVIRSSINWRRNNLTARRRHPPFSHHAINGSTRLISNEATPFVIDIYVYRLYICTLLPAAPDGLSNSWNSLEISRPALIFKRVAETVLPTKCLSAARLPIGGGGSSSLSALYSIRAMMSFSLRLYIHLQVIQHYRASSSKSI